MSQAGTLPRDPIDALIISQVLTLGMGTTGLGAGTVGPDGALYTSQAQTGLPNNGYGAIAGGTRPKPTPTTTACPTPGRAPPAPTRRPMTP